MGRAAVMAGKHRARRRRPGLAVLLVAGAAAAVVALAPTASAGPTPAGSDVVQMLRVATPQPSDRVRLAALGVDLTESGGPGYLDVLVYSPAQANLLRANGFRWTVRVADVAAEERARREA